MVGSSIWTERDRERIARFHPYIRNALSFIFKLKLNRWSLSPSSSSSFVVHRCQLRMSIFSFQYLHLQIELFLVFVWCVIPLIEIGIEHRSKIAIHISTSLDIYVSLHINEEHLCLESVCVCLCVYRSINFHSPTPSPFAFVNNESPWKMVRSRIHRTREREKVANIFKANNFHFIRQLPH